MFDNFTLVTVWYIFEWLLRVASLFIVPRNRRPAAATAWLLLIFLVPVPGLLLFAAIGSHKLPQRRRDAQARIDKYIRELHEVIKQRADPRVREAMVDVAVPVKYDAIARLSESLGHLPVFSQNNVEPITDYDEVFARMVADINKAKYFVYVEYYILVIDATTEPLVAALEAAQRRGVTVRVLFDDYGPRKYPGFRAMKQRFARAGIAAHAMLPLFPGGGYVRPDLRNHRKLVVIDSLVGYTGSHNMIQRNYHRRDAIVYDELVVRLTGPIVRQLQAIFLTDWYSETSVLLDDGGPVADEYVAALPVSDMKAQLLPSGPGHEDENNLKLFTALMYEATATITIVNPYFVPEDPLITALVSAARRGVRVVLVNSQAKDQWMVAHAQRSYYQEMLEAGVEIYLYKAPVLLHSKFIVVDQEIATVGSSNMDIRSFELDLELTLTVYDESFAAQLQAIADACMERSVKIDPEKWKTRRPINQLLDNIARLTSSLQ